MRIFFLLSFFLMSLPSWSKPQAFFHFKVFYTPDHQPFVSTSIQFSGGTFKYKANENGDLYAQVEITQIFKFEDSIVVADKYLLDSPLMKDSTVEDFFDVQHYAMGPGIYDYEITIKDVISGESVTGGQAVKVDEFNKGSVVFSDIEFIQDAFKSKVENNFVKNGFFMLPYLTNYFPPETDKIAFYTEIYGTDEVLGDSSQFLLTYSISDFDSGEKYEELFKFQRLQTNAVTPIIGYLPIQTLPSGNYNLEFYVIDKNNDTVQTEITFFQRRNDIEEATVSLDKIQIDQSFETKVDYDSIPFFLNSVMAIAERYEYESIRKMLKSQDTAKMAKYFYAFWLETDSKEPYRAWMDYKKQVYYAEKMFGTQIKHGFETDRGRTHLKYGSPNSIIDRPNEPSAYPYQIWHYYRIGQRSNIKFVFYNPDLVTNDYPMLHSDMQGELQNYRWQQDLHKRDNPNTNLEEPTNTIHYGGNSGLLYTNP